MEQIEIKKRKAARIAQLEKDIADKLAAEMKAKMLGGLKKEEEPKEEVQKTVEAEMDEADKQKEEEEKIRIE